MPSGKRDSPEDDARKPDGSIVASIAPEHVQQFQTRLHKKAVHNIELGDFVTYQLGAAEGGNFAAAKPSGGYVAK